MNIPSGGLSGVDDIITTSKARISIVHPGSKKLKALGGRAGTFWDSSMDSDPDNPLQSVAELTIVPIRFNDARVMWPEDEQGPPECRSYDNKVPASIIDSPPSTSCKSCEHSSRGGRCKFYYQCLAWRPDTEHEAWIDMKGSMIGAAKSAITKMKFDKVEPCQVELTFSLSDEGAYYAMNLKSYVEANPPDKYAVIATELMIANQLEATVVASNDEEIPF